MSGTIFRHSEYDYYFYLGREGIFDNLNITFNHASKKIIMVKE
ncbi:MAG: hypothetical protein XD78_2241 [Desulfotomaculum sp. 46_296]|nr:MAG: hypothetical protein XD78_2241 [Desulfotomaculum sp. 46_296]